MKTKILDAIQKFRAAWKTLSAATIVNCFHTSGTVPNAKVTLIWWITGNICAKIKWEVALDDFTGVDNDATVEDLREDETVSEIWQWCDTRG
jgi:hypothetical protein